MLFENLFLSIIIFFSLYLLLHKFKFLSDNISFSSHKKIGAKNKSPIMLGGFFLLLIILVFIPNSIIEIKLIFFLITVLGVLSDKNILPNPKIRFVFQITIILCLIHFDKLSINDVRLEVFNVFLENRFFNIFFTAFCLAILINGSNFIDGLNGLLTGYSIMILYSIIYINEVNAEISFFYIEYLQIILFSLMLFFIFNISGNVYLGDSGSYLISIFLGSFLIKFYLNNSYISPYYIALLLWYPAFENLFSLIRRIYEKKSISNPDNRHLHQLVFLFFKSKNIFSVKKLNPISSATILLFNFPSFLIASNLPSKSTSLIFMLSINIFLYLIVYNLLTKHLKIKK